MTEGVRNDDGGAPAMMGASAGVEFLETMKARPRIETVNAVQ